MCIMCDGATPDEARASLRHRIENHGYALQGVHPSGGLPGWVYTVGLTERFGHPELTIAACDLAGGESMLRHLVALIEDGAWLEDLDEVRVRGEAFGIGTVHPAQLRAGLLATWTDLYRSEGRFDLPLGALAVEAPELTCASCRWVNLRRPGPILSWAPAGRSGRDSRPKGSKRPNRKGPTRPGQYAARRRLT